MNIIQIAGHLGADPEVRFTPDGKKVVSLRVATNVRRGGKDETVWYKVAIWGDRWDKMLPHFKKGSSIIVVGELGKPDVYTDKEGRPQVSLEVTADILRFSPFGKANGQEGQSFQKPSQSSFGQNNGGFGGEQQPFASGNNQYFNNQSSDNNYNHADEEPIPF